MEDNVGCVTILIILLAVVAGLVFNSISSNKCKIYVKPGTEVASKRIPEKLVRIDTLYDVKPEGTDTTFKYHFKRD